MLGFIEASVGFTLQIVKYIGHPNVDKAYSLIAKQLLLIIKNFPAYNSLQPTKRHVQFSDIYDLVIAPSSKKAGNPKNTTNILKMRESGKLPSATLATAFICNG